MSRFLLAVLLAVSSPLAFTQAQKAPAPAYEPSVGQEGKDVVWVPTPQVVVDKMLDMAKVTKDDYVIDLGSGDGRTVITAAKRGARALGVEYNPNMVELSKRNAAKEGVSDRAQFVKADLFETDFSKATVITMFLLPDINLKLRPKILNLKPGTRVVSNTFTMGEWQPDETATVEKGCDGSWCNALFWIVPAKVAGNWTVQMPPAVSRAPATLVLRQQLTRVTGSATIDGNDVPLEDVVLRGDKLTFKFAGRKGEFSGQVRGNAIEGLFESGGSKSAWSAALKG